MAIKIIDKKKLIDDIDKQRLEREINILKNTFHYNIIKIYQVKETSNTICMIMEYAEGGELFNYIIDKGYLSEEESRLIFHQIIDAIYYLHQIGICHRDLKPENILFDSKDRKRIKIIDFGLSNIYMAGSISNNNNISFSNRKDFLETPCGSPGYAPPEMILGCKYDGIMTDIWSSGIILYAMLCGCLPFDDYSEDKLYSKIIKGFYDYPPNIDISEEVKNFINSILIVNPKQRATIEDIKKNKWFLKNYKPCTGLFISICEIPVSNLIVKEMQKRGYNEKKIIDCVKNNNHNSLTTIYYLLVKQKLKKGIETESDMISSLFQEYINQQQLKYSKENIRPISLKLFILKSKKYFVKNKNEKEKENKNDKNEKENKNDKNEKENKNDKNEKENKKEKENKNDKNEKENKKEKENKNEKSRNKDNKKIEINNREIMENENNNIIFNKENKSKERKSSKNKDIEYSSKENNFKKLSKKKNKTLSKDKNNAINNVHINNIKNIHYININNVKNNILMKTIDSDNNKIKLYKKITQFTKVKKEDSNSKNKTNNKLNTFNFNKMKEGQFRNYMNLQHIKKSNTNSKTKKVKKEKKNRVKNNKTMVGEYSNFNQINKDFNISLNNNDNKNNSITTDRKLIKKGIFLIKSLNSNNQDKFIFNNKIKIKKNKNFNAEMGIKLKQFYLSQIKNAEIIRQKNNSRKKSSKENDKSHKDNNLKIELIPKMVRLLNEFKTSRPRQNKYIMNSVSNSQSKSKSKTGGTHTSNSSNSKSKSKSNSIRDRLKKESFFVFRSSRNNYTKSKSGYKNIEKIYTNLTQEKLLSNLKSIQIAYNLNKDKNHHTQNKYELNQKNIMNKKGNIKGTNSKSKKKILSKQKNNSNNNYYYKIQNFRTSIEHHKLKKRIKTKNYMNIVINDSNNNNYIQRHNTIIIDNKSINDNNSIYPEQKQNKSLNYGVVHSKKDNIIINPNNCSQRTRKNEQTTKENYIPNHTKQKHSFQKVNLNHIKKNIKDKMNFHYINNYNKLKEYSKYSNINSVSNIQDEHSKYSKDFYNDLPNPKLYTKNKMNKIINSAKINLNNNNKKSSNKKIQISDLKSFQMKNLSNYQDIKPQTYRKNNKKFFDENIIHPFVNYTNSPVNNLY